MNSRYVLGHSDRELARLEEQARLVGPITRRHFVAAGLAAGMRVLEVGSGVGDTAFLAAELVGPKGQVVGYDRAPAALGVARKRAAEAGIKHVVFRDGDPAEARFDEPFDAVIGRYVLMFQPDPAAMLRRLAPHVREGGVIVFHEVDWDGAHSTPVSPLYDAANGWIVETVKRSGAETRMGPKLPAVFAAAGLPAPTLGLEAIVGAGGGSASLIRLTSEIVRSLLPEIERLGVAAEAEVGPSTLAERMTHEVLAGGSVLYGRSEMGAWCRTALVGAGQLEV